MGIYNDTIRDASELTAQARGAADAVEAADLLTQLMPSTESVTLDYDLDADALGLPPAASFRAYDAAAPYGKEQSVASKKGSLPASSQKLALGELKQLRLRQASDDAIGATMEAKARNVGQAIAIRAIFARGEAISDGKVTMDAENGLTVEIDFGRDGSHTVSAGTAWSTISADAIGDMLTWQAVLTDFPAGAVLTSSAVINALSLNTAIIKEVKGSGTSLTRISRDDTVALIKAFLGITDVRVYDKTYTDITGATTRPIPQDRFLLLPSFDGGLGDVGPVGQTLWGVPAEAFEADYGISIDDAPGIFAAAFKDTDPERFDILGSAIELPVPSAAGLKGVLSADVL
jgi:hypothetical protein